VSNFYARYPVLGGGSGSGVPIYANIGSFPAGTQAGQLAVAADTGNLFEWNGSAWVLIAGPGVGGSPYIVNEFTLSPTDIANKFVTLSSAPAHPTLTVLTVIGGPMQDYGPDFIVSGSTLSWSGLTLDGVLVAGDILIVQFY